MLSYVTQFPIFLSPPSSNTTKPFKAYAAIKINIKTQIKTSYIYSCNKSWSSCKRMDTQKEEVQDRKASEMNPLYYFSNIHALKSLYPTSESHPQNHKGHLHISPISKRKSDRMVILAQSEFTRHHRNRTSINGDRQLELTNCKNFDTSSNCLGEAPFSGTR